MRSHAKASTAGSTQRQAGRLGRIFRGADATRGASHDFKGSSAPRARHLVLPASVFVALVALLAIAIPASATKTHVFKELFGSAAQPTFTTPRGVAIDQSTGDLLVMDAGGPSIKRYNPDGTPHNFSALGTNVIDGLGGADLTPQNGLGFASASESQIAVDNSGTATDGDIYVTQGFPNAINVFSSAGAYLGQLTAAGATDFSEACGVTVDSAGAVYVGDYSGGIRKFVPSANPPVNTDNTATFTTTTTPCTLAAGAGATAGFLFPAKYNGPISKIDSATGELKYTVSADSNTTVSVNPATGHVYAATGSTVKEFDASGAGSATSVASISLSGSAQGIGVRGSSGDVFVSRSDSSKVEVFSGALVTSPDVTTSAATGQTGVHATLNGTVNPDGVELSECKFEYGKVGFGLTNSAPCAESNATIGTGTSPVAVHADISNLQPNGQTYVFRLVAKNATSAAVNGFNSFFTTPDTVISTAASGTTSTATTLNGTVNPDGVAMSECLFEWGVTTSYGNTAPCVPNAAGIGSGTSPVAVSADLSGLSVGTVYHYRLKAANANGPILAEDKSVQTTGPVIKSTWSQGVVFSEATPKAEINPEGSATTYHFEYGTSEAYGSETPELSVGSDSSLHTVARILEGLQPGTTYHYRVVATDSVATNEGPDRTFTTFEHVIPDTDCPNQVLRGGASANLPDCRGYEMVSPVDKAGGDIIAASTSTNLDAGSEQAAIDGEKMAYVSESPFGDAASSLFPGTQYIASRGAGGWSTHAITPPHKDNFEITAGAFSGSPGRYSAFSEDLSTGFLFDDAKPPLTADASTASLNFYLRDNVNETYEALTTQFLSGYTNLGGPGLMGYSEDGSHTIFAATAQLTPDAKPDGSPQLYDYHDGELELVSVLPGGEPAAYATAGQAGTYLSDESGEVRHAISDDGSRIFWITYSSEPARSGRLYARLDGEATVPVSESVPGGDEANYWAAAADGSQVIFSAGPGLVNNLYRFDVDTETPTLIAGEVSPATGVLGVSEDASHVYFISKEALAPGAVAGGRNLYLDDEGTKTFIGALFNGADYTAENGGDGVIGEGIVRDFSQVTPDGDHVVFQSRAGLTGYDNTSLDTGEAAAEIYNYDANADELTCISCNPSGARPHTSTLPQPHGRHETGFLNVPAAAWLPTPRRGTYTPRMVSDEGDRVFFNALDALVPEDTNGIQDVYEWVAQGSAGCEKANGCVALISTGKSSRTSIFIDAGEDGRDVFFRTSSDIDPEDPGLIDIYDARAGGGFPRPSQAPPCFGDSCQSPPPAPNDPTPASAGFRGAGNPVPTKPRRSCRARKAHRKAGKAQRKKANKRCKRNNRRAGR